MVSSGYYRSERDSYRWRTLRPVNSLLLVAPLLLVFHGGSASAEAPLFATRDLARILGVFGSTAWYLPPLLVAAALLVQHTVRRDRWDVRAGVLAGMVVESLLWAAPLLAINYLCSMLLSASGHLGAWDQTSTISALQAVGAGGGRAAMMARARIGPIRGRRRSEAAVAVLGLISSRAAAAR